MYSSYYFATYWAECKYATVPTVSKLANITIRVVRKTSSWLHS